MERFIALLNVHIHRQVAADSSRPWGPQILFGFAALMAESRRAGRTGQNGPFSLRLGHRRPPMKRSMGNRPEAGATLGAARRPPRRSMSAAGTLDRRRNGARSHCRQHSPAAGEPGSRPRARRWGHRSYRRSRSPSVGSGGATCRPHRSRDPEEAARRRTVRRRTHVPAYLRRSVGRREQSPCGQRGRWWVCPSRRRAQVSRSPRRGWRGVGWGRDCVALGS